MRSVDKLDGPTHRTDFFLSFGNSLSTVSEIVIGLRSLELSRENFSSSWKNKTTSSGSRPVSFFHGPDVVSLVNVRRTRDL